MKIYGVGILTRDGSKSLIAFYKMIADDFKVPYIPYNLLEFINVQMLNGIQQRRKYLIYLHNIGYSIQ